MPELDGFQALERIRDLSDIPVLMLPAHNTELERVRGLKAGADDYLGSRSDARSSSPGNMGR